MESEKVKEIKKALKQNIKTGIGFLDEKEDKMFFVSISDILTLINELESENERLMKLQARGGCRVAELGIENQQLKDRIAELEEYIKGNEQDAKAFVNGWHKDLKQELKLFVKTLKEKKPYFTENLVGVNVEHGWDMCIRVAEKTLKEFIDGSFKR